MFSPQLEWSFVLNVDLPRLIVENIVSS